MSLASNYDAVIAACVHVPQIPFYATEPPARYQFRYGRGNGRLFYRDAQNVVQQWLAPSPPAYVDIRWYENIADPALTDPIWSIAGYLATCASPGTFLGTARWLWMATLTIHVCNTGALIPIDFVHIQPYKSNVNSIGLVLYPNTPPG